MWTQRLFTDPRCLHRANGTRTLGSLTVHVLRSWRTHSEVASRIHSGDTNIPPCSLRPLSMPILYSLVPRSTPFSSPTLFNLTSPLDPLPLLCEDALNVDFLLASLRQWSPVPWDLTNPKIHHPTAFVPCPLSPRPVYLAPFRDLLPVHSVQHVLTQLTPRQLGSCDFWGCLGLSYFRRNLCFLPLGLTRTHRLFVLSTTSVPLYPRPRTLSPDLFLPPLAPLLPPLLCHCA